MALRTSLVAQPHLYMGDVTGKPLDYGMVYFGQPNKDPEFYPIDIYYDESLTVAASQPVRTKGGFLNANGDMVEVYAAETEYSVKVLDGYGRQVFYQPQMTKSSTGSSVSTKLPQIGAVIRTQDEKNSDYTTLMDFGGKCDGVTDDSNALQAYLDTNINVINIPDTCLIKKGVISNTPNRVIRTTGYGIICGTAAKNFEALTINGDNTQVHVDIDGRNSAYFGVVVNGDNCRVHKSTIQNIYNPFGAAIAIKVDGDVSAEITYNRLLNIDALTNNVLSDSAGACRGVWITSDTARTGNVIVSNNYIKNVLGEEGDAIQVIAFDGNYPFLTANTLVSDNTIINCNRRAIKIQASDCQVLNNVHINTLTSAQLLNAAWVIDVMYCNNVDVIGNTVDARVHFSGIGIKGSRTSLAICKDITVSKNIVNVGLLGKNTPSRPSTVSKQLGIYVVSCDNINVVSNDVKGSVGAVVVNNGIQVLVKDNNVSGAVVKLEQELGAIILTDNCDSCAVMGNTLFGGDRIMFLLINGKNSVVINNSVVGGSTPLITFNSNPSGSYIGDNINLGTGNGLSFTGELDKNVKMGQIITTQGNSLYPSIYFSRSKPETYHDKVWFSRGDIVYNALAYGTDFETVRGWRCTASGIGTVATWETI